tara:strand:- start:298 stop:603 length:306 start_codon:yes stop_codon:yes gene_type:complete
MSREVSIKQLPQITEINEDDLILVQTPNSTNTLLFKNFIIGLDNTTFSSTISSLDTKVTALSSVLFGTKQAAGPGSAAGGLSGVPIAVGGENFIILLSATA